MYGRRDLVDAHLFLRDRVSAAVMRVDPDDPSRPLRRTTAGLAWGIVVAAGAVVVVVVLQIFFFSGSDRFSGGVGKLIVATESGSRYLQVGDVLHPVLNTTSAALALGGHPEVLNVSDAKLASLPRGAAIGTPGWPDALPASSTTPAAWAVCTDEMTVSVSVSGSSTVTALPPESGYLVRSKDALFLVWDGTRSRVVADWAARSVGLDPASATTVPDSWLDTIPARPDLGPLPIEGGKPGPEIAGEPSTTGQVIEVSQDSKSERFLVVGDGLLPITEVVATLAIAGGGPDAPPAKTVSRADIASVRMLPEAEWTTMIPSAPLTAPSGDVVPCSEWEAGKTVIGVTPRDENALANSSAQAAANVGITSGLMVRSSNAAGTSAMGDYIVSEDGVKFPVASTATAKALGIKQPINVVPDEIIRLLPTGTAIRGPNG